MKEFPEEKLHELLIQIKKLKRQIFDINKIKSKLEEEYKKEFSFVEWKRREKKYFFIEGKGDNEIYYCNVLEVTRDEKTIEFVNCDEGCYSIEKITGKKDELKDLRWVEITKEEYEIEKAMRKFAE